MRTAQLATAALLFLAPGTPSIAAPLTFTWDPSKASPPLTAGPSSITADSFAVQNYLHAVAVNNLATLKQNFTEQLVQPITGFSLGGLPVVAPGLNSTYGLYLAIDAAGSFPINSAGSTIGPATFSAMSLSLVADVNHDDGTVGSTLSGITFSNPAGVANDVTLASGSFISAALSLDALGVRHATFVNTFVPVPGESGFLVAPNTFLELSETLTTLPAAFSAVSTDALTTVQMVNGSLGSTGQVQFVPEPVSLVLLGSALPLLAVRRRPRT